MQQTELQFQNWCVNQCKNAGVLVYKTAALGRRGFPDLLLVGGGQVVFVELKSPKGTGRLSDLQRHTIALLKDEGATVYVCNSREDFMQILQGIINGKAN